MTPDTLSQEEIDRMFNEMMGSAGDEDAEEEEEAVSITSEPGESADDEEPRFSINSLLRTRRSIKAPEKKYKFHDFRNPKIFTKDQMKTFSLIHENYVKHLSSFMSGRLRTECILTVKTIDELKYYEYNNTLSESVMMGILKVPPIEGNMIMEMSKPLVYTVIDRLLGGTGDDVVEQEDFSEIELRLITRFYEQIIPFLSDAWSSVAPVRPSLERLETNARLTQIMPFEETVVVIMVNVQIKEKQGTMSICIPCINLENILTNVSNYTLFSRKRTDIDEEANRYNLTHNLKRAPLEVRGVLGTTTLTLKDLLYLQKGDVIKLESTIDNPVTVQVGPYSYFKGEIGIKKNKMAVKVKTVL